jgi:hypothetical protein
MEGLQIDQRLGAYEVRGDFMENRKPRPKGAYSLQKTPGDFLPEPVCKDCKYLIWFDAGHGMCRLMYLFMGAKEKACKQFEKRETAYAEPTQKR